MKYTGCFKVRLKRFVDNKITTLYISNEPVCQEYIRNKLH